MVHVHCSLFLNLHEQKLYHDITSYFVKLSDVKCHIQVKCIKAWI